MTSEWPLRPLAAISTNFDTQRKPVKEAERVAGPYPYFGASGIVDYVDEYLFDGEYLLVAEDGENLRTRNTPIAFLATGKFWVNNHAHILQGNQEASTRYLNYALLAADIKPYLTGAVMPKLTQGNLNKIELPCPPRETQDQIVDVLGALDTRIDNLRQINATLDAITAALFKSWFVDFDGIAAKDMQESELGLIPKGWRVGTLSEVLSIQIGGAWGEESESSKSTVPVSCLRGIDAVEIGAGRKPDVPLRWVSQKQIASRILNEGDLLVEGSGSFCGRSLYWAEWYAALMSETPTYSNFVKRLASPRGKEASYWASFHLAGIYKSGEVSNYRTGSAFPNLDVEGLLSKKVAMPEARGPWEKFYAVAHPMLETRAQNILISATLSEVRDALLPRLIFGQLRVNQ